MITEIYKALTKLHHKILMNPSTNRGVLKSRRSNRAIPEAVCCWNDVDEKVYCIKVVVNHGLSINKEKMTDQFHPFAE